MTYEDIIKTKLFNLYKDTFNWQSENEVENNLPEILSDYLEEVNTEYLVHGEQHDVILVTYILNDIYIQCEKIIPGYEYAVELPFNPKLSNLVIVEQAPLVVMTYNKLDLFNVNFNKKNKLDKIKEILFSCYYDIDIYNIDKAEDVQEYMISEILYDIGQTEPHDYCNFSVHDNEVWYDIVIYIGNIFIKFPYKYDISIDEIEIVKIKDVISVEYVIVTEEELLSL